MAAISIDTLRPNLTKVYLPGVTVYFSYQTPVAFATPATGRVVSENIWSNTTAKHLTEIDGGDKKSRVPHAQFVAALAEVTAKIEEALA